MFNYVLPIFNHLANSIAFVTHNPLHNYYNRCKNKLPEECFPFRQPKLVVFRLSSCRRFFSVNQLKSLLLDETRTETVPSRFRPWGLLVKLI